MLNSLPHVCGSHARRRAGPAVWCRFRSSARTAVDLRALKEEQIAIARERIFGPQGNMPGDRQFRKPLEGRRLMRWYFPSKYNLQDFRTDEYYEMQAERFAPREPHESMLELTQTLEKVVRNREKLRTFFGSLDEATFNDNHSLQDLYGLFRLMDGDRALSFEPDEKVFKEHSPFGGPSPLLRVAASMEPNAVIARNQAEEMSQGTVAAAPAEVEPELYDLAALWVALQERVPKNAWGELSAKMSATNSLEEIRKLVTDAMKEHNFVPDVGAATATFYSEADFGKTAEELQLEEHQTDAKLALKEADAAFKEAAQKLGHLSGQEVSPSPDDPEPSPASKAVEEDRRPSQDEVDAAAMAREEAQAARKEALKKVHDLEEKLKEARAAQKERSYVRLPVRPWRLEAVKGDQQRKEEERRLAQARKTAEADIQREKKAGDVATYLSRRHRFVDPMFRRRRLKWLERQNAGLNNETEVKLNNYYSVHADKTAQWPTNRGAVHNKWPSPYH